MYTIYDVPEEKSIVDHCHHDNNSRLLMMIGCTSKTTDIECCRLLFHMILVSKDSLSSVDLKFQLCIRSTMNWSRYNQKTIKNHSNIDEGPPPTKIVIDHHISTCTSLFIVVETSLYSSWTKWEMFQVCIRSINNILQYRSNILMVDQYWWIFVVVGGGSPTLSNHSEIGLIGLHGQCTDHAGKYRALDLFVSRFHLFAFEI